VGEAIRLLSIQCWSGPVLMRDPAAHKTMYPSLLQGGFVTG